MRIPLRLSGQTFSYALSHIRPEIVQELDLVEHGFMPLLMESVLSPMENGDYLLLGQDEQRNITEIRRHSKHDADAYQQYSHDVAMVVRAIKPLLDSIPPNIISKEPEELVRMAALAQHMRDLPPRVIHNAVRLLTGTSAKVNFALDGLPTFPVLADRGQEPYRGFINFGPTMDYLERAFDDAKYGWFSTRPYVDSCIQTTIDPDMAPPGKHVMSNFVQYAPYELKDSDWDTERENLGDTVQAVIERFFPGFGDLVLHREIVTPLDIERTVGLSEGNIYAGEFLAPQMYFFRPAPGWNQYRTPIAGYYQCGSGTHPGGCVMGGPGRLAVSQIIGDLKAAG